MNAEKRKSLKDALEKIQNAKNIIGSVFDAETMSLENMPESLECSLCYEKLESNVAVLSDVMDNIDDIVDMVTDVIG